MRMQSHTPVGSGRSNTIPAPTQAAQLGMRKVMLTCFHCNAAAQGLYKRLGYTKDPSSPDPETDGPEYAGCAHTSPRLFGSCTLNLQGTCQQEQFNEPQWLFVA